MLCKPHLRAGGWSHHSAYDNTQSSDILSSQLKHLTGQTKFDQLDFLYIINGKLEKPMFGFQSHKCSTMPENICHWAVPLCVAEVMII